MQPEILIPRSQQYNTSPYPEAEQFISKPILFLKILFNIILLPMTRSFKLSLSLTFPQQNHVRSLLSHNHNHNHNHDTCTVQLIVGDAITRIFGDKYRL